jgi:hypothetical protein
MSATKVQQGDCCLSLSAKAGLFFQTVWDDPANAALKAKRKLPNILMPGDVLEVRPTQERREDGASTKVNTFVVKGVPARLRLRLRIQRQPVANKSIKLIIDGAETAATTDGDGRVDVPISPQAVEARLRIDGEPGEFLLQLGLLDPLDEVSGLQGRLFNLGFDPRGIDNKYGKNTRKAMQGFQKSRSMRPTERPDAPTRAALESEYGC